MKLQHKYKRIKKQASTPPSRINKNRWNSSWNTGILCHDNPTWIWKIIEEITVTMKQLKANTGTQANNKKWCVVNRGCETWIVPF